MPLIYFVRHGQTDWNATRRLQGHFDISINAQGRLQAKRNGGVLNELISDAARFDFVASPMLRTRETMEILRAELGLPPEDYRTDPRIREISFGAWAGQTMDQVACSDPQNYAAREADYWNVGAPEGECWRDFYARVMDWLASVSVDTIVVAHGGVSRCLRRHYLNLSVDDMVRLDVPQDKVMMIENETITWL